MARLELPIPPGFVVTTEACLDYFALGQQFPEGLWKSIQENMGRLEEVMGRGFGSISDPLLVSVRSEAKISMPGMMDTILNLGINDDVVDGLASLMGEPRLAYDAYRRFL
jgi:pyruvate, orthophosphate dikinase